MTDSRRLIRGTWLARNAVCLVGVTCVAWAFAWTFYVLTNSDYTKIDESIPTIAKAVDAFSILGVVHLLLWMFVKCFNRFWSDPTTVG